MQSQDEFHEEKRKNTGEEIVKGTTEENFLKWNEDIFFLDCTGPFTAEKNAF